MAGGCFLIGRVWEWGEKTTWRVCLDLEYIFQEIEILIILFLGSISGLT